MNPTITNQQKIISNIHLLRYWGKVKNHGALNPDMQAWMKRVNPHALHNIIDNLLEAATRDLWRPEYPVNPGYPDSDGRG